MRRRFMARLSRQLSHPSGRGGRVVAALMNRGNRGMNERAVELLGVRPDERALDLGFGGGVGLDLLLARGARVTGVDRAADAVAAARDARATAVAEGRLTVLEGDVLALPLEDDGVDAAVTVNTVYFWPDLDAGLAELRRVLAPGGRLVVAIRDGAVMTNVDRSIFTIRPPEELEAALRRAGFPDVRVESKPGRHHLLLARG